MRKRKKEGIKNLFLTKPALMIIVAIVFIAGISISFFNLPIALGQEKRLPVYSVDTKESKIAISFDAAWGNCHTRPLLDILDDYEIKTTFFLVDFWAEKYPDDVKEIANRGHEIGNHSTTHPDMTKLDSEGIKKEINKTGDTIEKLTGIKPTLFRPPFGAYNNLLIETCETLEYKVIQWSVDSLDWKEISATEIVERVLGKIEPGDIVLFHNNADHIEEYLPLILKGFKEKEYQVVPIGDLIYKENYHIDNTGKQILN